jgi:hypothetical protein
LSQAAGIVVAVLVFVGARVAQIWQRLGAVTPSKIDAAHTVVHAAQQTAVKPCLPSLTNSIIS